ncbi:MAG TPA: TonB-dependent receptor [Kofleriaceae bacterium]|nr:TonB-dependent receptor [Kofleriaceae bacterium]
MSADSSADEADQRFKRGAALFKAGKVDEALLEFFSSNRLAHNHNVVFNIARSYEALGRFEEAYRYYAEYRDEESDAEERASVDRKLAELAPRVALLRIETTPPGATVYLERKDLGGRGETPLVIAVAPGEQTVLLERAGYVAASVRATAERGRAVTVTAPLELIVGTVRVSSRPAAAVFVDRVAGARTPAAGRTPVALALTPGRHTLELEAADHRTHRADVMITTGAATELDVALEARPPPSGTVVLASKSAGALVLVDGAASGFTPAVLTLPSGAHEIEVRGDRMAPWRRRVTVETDARLFYEVELTEAEQEVTGATRTAQTVSSAPASVSLVTRDEIWAFGYRTLTEAVGSVRGVYVSDDRSYEAIGVRGFSRPGDFTNRVVLLRDGHVMNDDWIGSAAVGRDFAADLDDIERIEVVRGPGSTFYGAAAFFGVIQVVSQAPGAGPPVRAGGALDSEGGGVVFARGAQRVGPAALSLYASMYDSSGRTVRYAEFDDGVNGGEVRDADAEDAQRAGVRVAAGDFAVDASYARRRKALSAAPYGTLFDPASFDGADGKETDAIDRRAYAEARWDHARGPLTLAARAAYDYQQYDGVYVYEEEPTVFTDEGGGDWWTGEARGAFAQGPSVTTVGGEVARHRVSQGYDEDGDGTPEVDDVRRYFNGSVYAVEDLALGERAAVSAGVRFDWFGESDENAISPRVGVVLHPYADGTTKLVAGRAFRAPSVYELPYVGDDPTAPTWTLEPETIWTGEVEHTHALGTRAHLVGSLFGSRIQDLILYGVDEDDNAVFLNSPDLAWTAGGEAELRVAGPRGVWASAAASYTNLETDVAQLETNSSPLLGSLRGFWPALGERLGLAAELVYNHDRPRRDASDAGPALLARLFASGRLADGRLWYRAGVTNLLDWDWSVPVGDEYEQRSIRQEPRTFHAQLMGQFD